MDLNFQGYLYGTSFANSKKHAEDDRFNKRSFNKVKNSERFHRKHLYNQYSDLNNVKRKQLSHFLKNPTLYAKLLRNSLPTGVYLTNQLIPSMEEEPVIERYYKKDPSQHIKKRETLEKLASITAQQDKTIT